MSKEKEKPLKETEITEDAFVEILNQYINNATGKIDELSSLIKHFQNISIQVLNEKKNGMIVHFYKLEDGSIRFRSTPKGHIGFGPHARS